MVKTRTRVVLAAAIGVPAFLASLGSAGAQTGYPGPTSTAPPQPTAERQNAGQVRPGEQITIESCGFEPRSETAVAFNGAFVENTNADATGCADVDFSVRDDCPGVTVDGQPRDGRRGRNELVVTGDGANGASREVTTGVTVSCSQPGGQTAGSASKGEGAGDPGATVQARSSGEVAALDQVVSAAATTTRSSGSRAGLIAGAVAAVAGAAGAAEVLRRRRRASL